MSLDKFKMASLKDTITAEAEIDASTPEVVEDKVAKKKKKALKS